VGGGDSVPSQPATHRDDTRLYTHMYIISIYTDLEAHIDVGAVDGGGPPEREAAVGDLVETGPLRLGQLLVLHRLLEAAVWFGVVSGMDE
jgi:hypothetical protein